VVGNQSEARMARNLGLIRRDQPRQFVHAVRTSDPDNTQVLCLSFIYLFVHIAASLYSTSALTRPRCSRRCRSSRGSPTSRR
jgi:hypothetical protein